MAALPRNWQPIAPFRNNPSYPEARTRTENTDRRLSQSVAFTNLIAFVGFKMRDRNCHGREVIDNHQLLDRQMPTQFSDRKRPGMICQGDLVVSDRSSDCQRRGMQSLRRCAWKRISQVGGNRGLN